MLVQVQAASLPQGEVTAQHDAVGAVIGALKHLAEVGGKRVGGSHGVDYTRNHRKGCAQSARLLFAASVRKQAGFTKTNQTSPHDQHKPFRVASAAVQLET
jgi:hypothetical protein